jgi:hypothetical protein
VAVFVVALAATASLGARKADATYSGGIASFSVDKPKELHGLGRFACSGSTNRAVIVQWLDFRVLQIQVANGTWKDLLALDKGQVGSVLVSLTTSASDWSPKDSKLSVKVTYKTKLSVDIVRTASVMLADAC